ncbi:MAG: DUF4255 domain-containing protein [Chloroflexi bacterium]|nr:DUF4255 domain-containing protein [Chloroflexota bacterium]
MFADLDETIRQLLVCHVPLDLAEVDISFEAPDREWSGRLSRPTVNCFLFAVQENLELREYGWEVQRGERTATRQRGPVRVDAAYQVTSWARAPEDEHRLLWRVLAALARHPILPQDLLQGSLKDQPVPVPARVARPDAKPQVNPADLWQALENRIRPAIHYSVTLALDLEVVFTSPMAFTRAVRMDQLNGHEPTEALQISGRVYDREAPKRGIPEATVVVAETGIELVTDEEGRFVLARARRGPMTLVVRAPGRPEATRTVEVPSVSYDVEV